MLRALKNLEADHLEDDYEDISSKIIAIRIESNCGGNDSAGGFDSPRPARVFKC